MSRKQEIKVYLPVFQVGQMEHMKNKGTRSAFISNAIRSKFDKLDKATPFDYSVPVLLATARDSLDDEWMKSIIQLIIDKVMA